MSRTIPFFVCDSFTDTPFQGNPAGVFFDDAGSLTADEMRRLAGEVHLESAFVLPAGEDAADFRLRYFTGVTEVPLCGHATIAALSAMVATGRADEGQAFRAWTNVGLLPLELAEGGTGTMFQNPPEFSLPLPAEVAAEIAGTLGIAPAAIARTGLPVQRVSTGTPWLYVPVASRAEVDATPADFTAVASLSDRLGVYGVYIFTVERDGEGGAALTPWSRCYAPLAGLPEDPVTGSASGALGGYLAEHGVLAVAPGGGGARFRTQQGFAGGRGGSAQVAVSRETDGSYSRIAVSGRALVLAQGAFTL